MPNRTWRQPTYCLNDSTDSLCDTKPATPSCRQAETEPLSEAEPSSKEAAPCSRSPMTCYLVLIFKSVLFVD